MPYAILRFEKRKGGPATAIEKHHERKNEQYASNPDVDRSRSDLNYHLIQPQMKYYAEIQSRIEKSAERKSPVQGSQGQREVYRHHRHRHAGIFGNTAGEKGAPLL